MVYSNYSDLGNYHTRLSKVPRVKWSLVLHTWDSGCFRWQCKAGLMRTILTKSPLASDSWKKLSHCCLDVSFFTIICDTPLSEENSDYSAFQKFIFQAVVWELWQHYFPEMHKALLLSHIKNTILEHSVLMSAWVSRLFFYTTSKASKNINNNTNFPKLNIRNNFFFTLWEWWRFLYKNIHYFFCRLFQ